MANKIVNSQNGDVSQSELFEALTKFINKINTDEISELDFCSRTLLNNYLNNLNLLDATAAIKIQAVIDYMYEQVNIGNWKEVKPFLRKTITIASYLRILAYLRCSKQLDKSALKETFKFIDFGILFGCPLDSEPKLLQNCARVLSSVYDTSSNIEPVDIKLQEIDVSMRANNYNADIVKIISHPSMESFYQNYIMTNTPVILTDCINHWPALEKWKDQNYFLKNAGQRTVSVELGSSYTDSNWTQKLMTIEEFIHHHVLQSDGPTGYLAQYQLFEHIPELREDIAEPEYCCFSDNDLPVEIMSWYGPKGTVSPLHHDPKRNLLAQVVGQKQIFLFSPNDSSYLYPHGHELLDNTSQVDPRKPNLEKYPHYKDAKPYYCVLSPGQMLYIPPKWWHFVESLSISFSVSFWWE